MRRPSPPALPLSLILACASLAGCVDGRPGATLAAAPPGGMNMLVKTPGDWIRVPPPPGSSSAFFCKALACATPTTARISSRPTLARHPDPTALERYAKVDLPKLVRAQDASNAILSDGGKRFTLVSSVTGVVKDHPAVLVETKDVNGGKTTFAVTDIVFVGPVMVYVTASSADRQSAKAGVETMLQSVQFTEGPDV